MAKKKAVTIEEVETPKVDTPEIVKEEKKSEIKERTYDELVLLSKEAFAQVEADVKAGRAKFKSQ